MALVTIRRSPSVRTPRKTDEAEKALDCNEDDAESRISKSLNECYFANKGAAVVLGGERDCPEQRRSPVRALPQPDIQHHLQSMFYLVRTEETLKMAVKLESAHAGRTRYLVVVCRGDEAALLGVDCNHRTTVGLVLRVLADTSIKLDGDGGFSVCVCNQQHIFKPVSVQAMWSALQTLHRASGRARELNHFAGGASHAWCAHYERRVDSDRSCLNEWHAMDCIESRRPPSPDSLRHKPRERDETERVIRCTLKEIMMSVDLDEVTSKVIRGRLEDDLDMDLAEYKSFIDQEMLTILGQMDSPTEIFDHVLLGSEWNASNLEELQRNGVRHILNVTREIDNFFPGMFDYLNIRVYDDDKTDLLKHWDNTFKYINKARNEGSKVLVHCKMGISRSASVVIAYAMKAFNWNFERALKYVKAKRNCIKPNTNFLNQLETYQGILDAMKNKEKLQRSKSETNLKSPKMASKIEKVWSPTRVVVGVGGGRPRSWSPDSRLAAGLLPPPPTSVSLESLAETRHMLTSCAGGSYSVSPNQVIRLRAAAPPSVRLIVHEIENAASGDRKHFARKMQRLQFGNPTEPPGFRSADQPVGAPIAHTTDGAAPVKSTQLTQVSPLRNLGHKYPLSNFEADKIHTWDPGESHWLKGEDDKNVSDSDNIVECDSGIVDVKTNKVLDSETFSNCVESKIECKETNVAGEEAPSPSRQSSWSSLESGAAGEGAHGLAIISEHVPPARPAPAPARREDNERKFNETCAILKELSEAAARARGACTWGGPLSASAPEGDAWLPAGLRRRRPACASHPTLPTAPPPLGRVTNLKREFEARSQRTDPPRPRRTPARNSFCVPDRPPPAPSGPLLTASDPLQAPSGPLQVLGGPLPTPSGPLQAPSRPQNVPSGPLLPLDYADVVVSTVMSKAQNKKQLQHGKTHPLTRLNVNRPSSRCSNPVYNTM